MAQHRCMDPDCNCGGKAMGKNLFCAKAWFSIPEEHRMDIRQGTKKGEHTLRAKPSREWMTRALRYIRDPRKVPLSSSESYI
jgi:hypothetical protein